MVDGIEIDSRPTEMLVSASSFLSRFTKSRQASSDSSACSLNSIMGSTENTIVDMTPSQFTSWRQASIESESHCTVDSSVSFTDVQDQERRPNNNRRGHVRFEFDENDQVKSQVYEYEAHTDEEKALCFTTVQQGKKEKILAWIDATKFAHTHANYLQILEKLFDSPLQCSDSLAIEDEQEAIRVIGECEARGMEALMSQAIRLHKHVARRLILGRQAHLRNAETELSKDELAENLRLLCEDVNKSFRDLARKYAMADEIEAQNVYGDPSVWKSSNNDPNPTACPRWSRLRFI